MGELADGLQRTLTEACERHGVPGAAAGIAIADAEVVATYGVTSVDHPLPVDDRTLFQIGSITKTFTASAVALLVGDGTVAFEDPIARHLPDLTERTGLDGDRITVEHLLSHQSGFDGDHLLVHGGTRGLDGLAGARHLFEPGTGYSYNNAGFSVAGALVERIAEQPFAEFVRERLLKPRGLDTACFTADEAITHRVAAPHWVVGGQAMVLRHAGWQPGWELADVDWPAGGLIASVRDLLAWGRWQWSADLPPAVRRLQQPVVRPHDWLEIGLDWHVEETDGERTLEHGGLTVGYASTLVVAPARQVAVVALTHATNGGLVNDRIRRWALATAAGIHEGNPEPAAPPAAVDSYLGTYVNPFALLVVREGDEPGKLTLEYERREGVDGWQPPPDEPVGLTFVGPDQVASLDGEGIPGIGRFGPDWFLWRGRRSPRA